MFNVKPILTSCFLLVNSFFKNNKNIQLYSKKAILFLLFLLSPAISAQKNGLPHLVPFCSPLLLF